MKEANCGSDWDGKSAGRDDGNGGGCGVLLMTKPSEIKVFAYAPDANRGVAGTWQDWRYRNLGTGVSKETPAKACRRRAKQWRENWSALCLRRSSRDSNGTPIPVPLLNDTGRLSAGKGARSKADGQPDANTRPDDTA
ncbi:hypothetical protein VI06_17740 [Aquitalea magnusonii]|nr:hypothetical protein VI06_17740 [Aquitalea magnusonii]